MHGLCHDIQAPPLIVCHLLIAVRFLLLQMLGFCLVLLTLAYPCLVHSLTKVCNKSPCCTPLYCDVWKYFLPFVCDGYILSVGNVVQHGNCVIIDNLYYCLNSVVHTSLFWVFLFFCSRFLGYAFIIMEVSIDVFLLMLLNCIWHT